MKVATSTGRTAQTTWQGTPVSGVSNARQLRLLWSALAQLWAPFLAEFTLQLVSKFAYAESFLARPARSPLVQLTH